MSAIAAAVKHMLEAGMPHDSIVSAVEAMEMAIRSVASARQERNRRYYEKKKAETLEESDRLKASENRLKASETSESVLKRLKTSENVLIQTPLARVRDNITNSEINTQTVVDVSASATASDARDDWPSGDPVKAALQAVNSPRLDPTKSQGLVLTSGRFAAWRSAGASWEHDVLPVVRASCAKARGQIQSWKYFDPAIAQSIADNREALKIPEATANGRSNSPASSQRNDRLGRMLAGAQRAVDES